MKTYQDYADALTTIGAVMKQLNYKSRTSIESLIANGDINYVEVNTNTPYMIRLIIKDSVQTYIEGRVNKKKVVLHDI